MDTALPRDAANRESVHNLLPRRSSAMDVFFKPSNVAVIGATETPGTVGRTLLRNLISTPFGGTVFPVNPKRPNVLGIKAYPKVGDIPEPVDLAVIITPAPTVPGIVGECVQAGVRGAIIISAGFKEIGPEGQKLEADVLRQARQGSMRIIGPNCLGLLNPLSGINASFAPAMALPGNVGFISQSGALCAAVLDWSLSEQVGFSAFVSIGSMLDIGWGDLIDYLGDDPHTRSIVIYMETVGDARSFLSAAREVALTKPIIVIKPGRTEGAAKAAASHTGSLAGSDDVLDAAFRRCGVLRVNRISDLFDVAEVLAKQPRPKGKKLTIITNAGGPGVLATDSLLQTGGELAPISKDTMDSLNKILPGPWSHGNPIDVLGDAGPDRYAKTLEIVAQDPASDGVLVILTPQAMTDATLTAEVLKQYAKLEDKPLIASWMGGAGVATGGELLKRAGIPDFPYPDTAARIFTYMYRYAQNLRSLYETPEPAKITEEGSEHLDQARALIEKVQQSGRSLLTEFESKELLASYGIPVVKTLVAQKEDEAVRHADDIGYPVVLKLFSETVTHKTDVGGVQLNLRDPAAVRGAFKAIRTAVTQKAGAEAFGGVTVQPMIRLEGYELIVGSSIDPQFGPVLLFGAGGQLVEVFKDRALGLPPLNTTLARRLMERTKIYTALQGVRGRKPIDLKALEQLMVRFSQLVSDHRRIKEIDINPLLASPDGLLALDARVVLHDARIGEDQLPRQAIRPYPVQYTSTWKAKNGPRVTIRPIRHQDEPMMAKFHEGLSERSVYLRFSQPLKLSQRVTHERLLRRCFINYEREMALVADAKDGDGAREILGVARLTRLHGASDAAEFALLVSDKVQRQGLGTELLKRLLDVARAEGIRRITAAILRENDGMQELVRRLGFRIADNPGQATVTAEFELPA